MPDQPISPSSPQAAINAALSQDWKAAIHINMALVKDNPQDIDALNRLGFAYLQTGQLTGAKRTFDQVLALDPYNQIALKNAKKLSMVKRKDIEKHAPGYISPLLFLEEPGKTKIVALVNTAPIHILASLSAGQDVDLKPKNHCVEIRSAGNVYLGALPDDLSFKLLKLIAHGNRYHVVIKSIGKNVLTVLVREVSRGKRFASQPSFTVGNAFVPRDRVEGKDTPDMTPTGEDDGESANDEAAPA